MNQKSYKHHLSNKFKQFKPNRSPIRKKKDNKCSKCLLQNSFSKRIYPGTTQILLTINVNTQLQSHELPVGAILLAIEINQKLATIKAQLKGTILHLFTKTGSDYSLSKQYGVTISTGIFLQVRYELGL